MLQILSGTCIVRKQRARKWRGEWGGEEEAAALTEFYESVPVQALWFVLLRRELNLLPYVVQRLVSEPVEVFLNALLTEQGAGS